MCEDLCLIPGIPGKSFYGLSICNCNLGRQRQAHLWRSLAVLLSLIIEPQTSGIGKSVSKLRPMAPVNNILGWHFVSKRKHKHAFLYTFPTHTFQEKEIFLASLGIFSNSCDREGATASIIREQTETAPCCSLH